jgi:uncharacterized RDD family membrane protein YckC
LEHQPLASFFSGIALFVVLGPLLFLLLVSVAGIPVIPFVICALIVAALFGKVAVYAFTGQQIGRGLRLKDLSLPLVLLLGTILFYLIYMVPVLGFAVWGIATLFGVGAVLLSAFGSLRPEPAASVGFVPPPAAAPGSASLGSAESASAMPSAPPAVTAIPPVVSALDVALLPRVGFWRRLLATALDFVLLCLLIPVAGPFFLVIWAAYHVAMWSWKGTTIGGIVMSVKIVRTDGKPVDFAVALVRSLSSFFSAFALFLGFFWAGWDRERQAWHDKIAGTIVVRVPRVSLI